MEPTSNTELVAFFRPFLLVPFLLLVWLLKKWLYRLFKPGKLRDALYKQR